MTTLTRRQVLAGALLLPPTLAENAAAGRRLWALDRTMTDGVLRGYGAWEVAHIGWSRHEGVTEDLLRVRRRRTPRGVQEEIVWVSPAVRDSLVIARAPGGGFLIDFRGEGD